METLVVVTKAGGLVRIKYMRLRRNLTLPTEIIGDHIEERLQVGAYPSCEALDKICRYTCIVILEESCTLGFCGRIVCTHITRFGLMVAVPSQPYDRVSMSIESFHQRKPM
jgi:hypothetical protein